MKKSYIVVFAFVVLLALAGAYFVNWCWNHRETPETRKAARKEVSAALRAMPSEGVLGYLEKLASEKSMQFWFEKGEDGQECPCRFWTLRMASRTRVPYDYIAQLTEDQIIRFAGNDADRKAEVPRIKEMLAFSEKLMPLCSENSASSLLERRLDGFFLAGDFDSAINLLESGKIKTRTPAWCKSTAAKLRAHKAEVAKDYKEAIKQLLVFIDFMLSDEQKDFEDCDPTTGLMYSRYWVLARNYLRCMRWSGELKDSAKVAEFKELAKKQFAEAIEKAKSDVKALAAIKEEMKSAGL